MALVVLALVLVLITVIYFNLKHYFAYWQRRGVPHEKPYLIFGNLKGIGTKKHFRDVNMRIYNRFKNITPITGGFYFFTKTVFILDLDLIKQILIKDFANFHDRGIFKNIRDDPLMGHLITLEGEQWRAMRTKLTPVFTSGKMKFMFPNVQQVGDNLATTCGAMIAETPDGVLELKELSARYTTDVIGTCAFGIECNSLKNPNAEFRQKGRQIIELPRHSRAVQAFMITNPELACKLRMKMLHDSVSEFFIAAVRDTVDYRIKNGIKRNDFMDMLIEMKAQDEKLAEEGKSIDLSHGLTLLQMAAQAFSFFVAGFDTTSTTMAFCLYELALNPAVQTKLREEILEALKAHNGALTYDAVLSMAYLEQVVLETLRKYPVLPHIIRKTVADYRVPNTPYTIERGNTVIIPVDAIHHDPALFPEPEKFDPTRFTPEAMQRRHACAYLPFGEGPRNCIGFRFGKMQAKVGLISLLQHYKFSASARTDIPVQYNNRLFFITARNGIHLKVEKLM